MIFLILIPFAVQTLIIMADEFYFHVKRGLPKWERLGHPLDTLTVLACFAFVLFVPYSSSALKIYIALSIFSCFFVTKDEFVHKECCPASEQWLHAILFLNHPILLTATGLLWRAIDKPPLPLWINELVPYAQNIQMFFYVQTGFSALFFIYQLIYWNILWKDKVLE